MTPIARIPRTRGAFSGVLLVLLGAWGGLIAFIGPYFHYAYTPDKAWVYTTGRLWLEILPGAATVLGGLLVLGSARRHTAAFGAFLAALGGAWFVVGNLVSTLWNSGTPQAGVPAGTGLTRLAAENLGFFTGLGVLIVFFAALALGRFAVVGVRETAMVERAAADEAAWPSTKPPHGTPGRSPAPGPTCRRSPSRRTPACAAAATCWSAGGSAPTRNTRPPRA